ncbi:MAG: tetratricopeptide repeat protein [Candidatus Omnitrophota bacterium]
MRKLKIYILVFFLISVVCFLAYSNSLANPFIWDDQALVVKNTLIRSLSNLPKAFTSDLYFGISSGSNFYRPLQTVSYIFDYHFWQLNPLGYHLTNVFLQAGVAFLVFLLCLNLSIDFPIALACSLFFASGPIHTESVTYVSGRAEMLMGFFVIISLLFFIRSQRRELKHQVLFYVISAASFILALLSKEIAIIYPLIVCGYIFYFLHDRFKEKHYVIKNILPFAVIAIIYLLLRLSVFNFSTLRQPSLTNVAWFIRLSVLPNIIFTYFKLLLLPVGLHMSRELARPVTIPGVFLAILSFGLIILVCWHYLKYQTKNKLVSFMLFWALVFFIPQSGIFPINAFVAEHFIYLSSISFYFLLALVFSKAARGKPFILIAGLFCVFYILLTNARNFEWKNPVIFYQNIIKYSPDSFQAHNNLGLEYEYLDKFKEAQFHYCRALEIKPDLIEARANLANLYFKLKLYEKAKQEYEVLEQSKLGAKVGEAENNLGNIYEVTGELQKAIGKYNQALSLDPSFKFTHFNLARIYYSLGDVRLAVSHLAKSLGDAPDREFLFRSKIIADFLKNTASLNNAAEFYNNLGIDFAKNNAWQAAIASFDCALELKPGSSDYFYNLGLAYLNLSQKSKAKIALKRALQINPNHIRAKSLITKN